MSPRLLLSLFPIGLSLLGPEARATTPDIGGEYCGVIQGDSFETSGRFRMVLSRTGRGSVSVCVGDEPPCVVGVGYDPVHFTILPVGPGDADMILHLQITPAPDGTPVVTGIIDDEDETFTIQAARAVKKYAAAGSHTFVLGSATSTSADAGFGYAKVAPSGKVAGVVQVGQHQAVSFGGRLTPDGKLPISARFGDTDTSVVGNLSFAAFGTGGTVTAYDAAAPASLHFWRTPYHPRSRPLVGTPGAFALATTIGGVLSGIATQLNNGSIVNATLSGTPAKLKVVRRTGFVTGGTKTSALRGVVMQDLDVLAGLCNGAAPFRVESTGLVAIGSHTESASSGSLIKTGSGNLTYPGSNSSTGTITVNSGALSLSGTNSLTPTQTQSLSNSFAGMNQLATAGQLTGSLTISAGTITFNNAFVSPVVVPANPQLTSGTLLPPPTVSLSDPLLTNSPLTLQNNNTVPYLAYIPGSPINIDSSIGVSGGATIGFVSGGTLTLNGFTGSTLAITGTGTLPLSGGIYVNGSIVTLANPGSGGVPLLGPSQLLADGWIETEPGTYVSPTGQTLKITTPPTP